jgi:deoxyribodipyrimidine photo-lyase
MTVFFESTRAAGLERLHQFAPRMGRRYADGRNTDNGPGAEQDVSMLSPWLRRRLLTETEVVAAARAAHGDLAEKFVQEVVWRSYFKGWLEQHPGVWQAYLDAVTAGETRLATEAGLRRVYHDTCEGRTGIDGFDHWARELVGTGWLHNHARMWFASIWIFTLRLPWALGAAFFLRHLLDGDPASNTLSWRWVAGLHTRGKHYLARADNIARYTNGRFDPRGQLDEAAEPLVEAVEPMKVRLAAADPRPSGDVALLLHDDDLHPESLGLDLDRARSVAVVTTARGAGPVVAFAEGAIADTEQRIGRSFQRLVPAGVAAWAADQSVPVVTPWAPVGPAASLLAGLDVVRIRRDWDSAIWPHATRGFFQVRQRLPELLPGLLAELA